MLTVLRHFIFPSVPALKYAIKTLIAAMLSLWIAFYCDLDKPFWSAATVFIVSQPHAGMVVSKGLARLLGTVMGTIISIIMTAIFAQTAWLFLLVIAVWLGICTAASTIIKSAWSYAFALAGYTTAIVILPELANPLYVFDYAVSRCTEISLGIICASSVAAILWPQKIHYGLVNQAFKTWQAGLVSARSALLGEPINEDFLNSLTKIFEADTQREHAVFEGADGRNRAKAMQQMCHNILEMFRAARSVARQFALLSEEEKEPLQGWYQETLSVLKEPSYQSLQQMAKKLHKAYNEGDIEQKDIIIRLESVIRHAMDSGLNLSAVRSGRLKGKISKIKLSVHRDYSLGIFFGFRTATAFLAVAIFWMLTAWKSYTGAMMMVSVLCCMFANKENAAQISMGFLRGTVYSSIVGFFIAQIILPSWSGYPLLWIALGTPIFFCLLGMSYPPIAGTCMVFAINLIMVCQPSNHTHLSTELFINQAIAMSFGIIAAVLAFNLIKINTPYWQGKYMLGAMLRDLRRLIHGSSRLETWFSGRMADRLILLAQHRKVLAKNANRRWEDALYTLDMGDELLYLRGCFRKSKDIVLQKQLSSYLNVIAAAVEAGPSLSHKDLLVIPSKKFANTLKEKGADMSLALSAIKQLQQTWQQWCIKTQESDSYGVA